MAGKINCGSDCMASIQVCKELVTVEGNPCAVKIVRMAVVIFVGTGGNDCVDWNEEVRYISTSN